MVDGIEILGKINKLGRNATIGIIQYIITVLQ